MHAYLDDYLSEAVINAIQASASNIEFRLEINETLFEFTVTDNGPGFPPEKAKAPGNPFVGRNEKHPWRPYGFGLPFLAQLCEHCEGDFRVESWPGQGSRISARLNRGHVDAPPLGDLPSTLAGLIAFPGQHELRVHRLFPSPDGRQSGSYQLGRKELEEVLEGFDTPGAYALLDAYIRAKEEEYGKADT